MTAPTADEQVRFLTNLQRLLHEGQYFATYKYALLLSLADISIEHGDDSGGPLTVPTRLIAERFVYYYWRQAIPYVVPGEDRQVQLVLRQNLGDRQPSILTAVKQARERVGSSIHRAQRKAEVWESLIRAVDRVVRDMPLWKLQTVGRGRLQFLYENRERGDAIELLPGVAFSFRRFYELVTDLVQGAWIGYIQRHPINQRVLGTLTDLGEFMFGSDRVGLAAVRPVLDDLQRGRCFYCQTRAMKKGAHVDHFISWSRYPMDLGHNFVLAHNSCNSQKADRLAATEHLHKWVDRNARFDSQLVEAFDDRAILHDLGASIRIASWAYKQVEAAGGLLWQRRDNLVNIEPDWETPMSRLLDRMELRA